VDASALLHAIAQSDLGRTMRDSRWLYPLVESAHIVGIVVLVGAAAMFDLRLLGVSRDLPIRALGRHLLPWSVGALAVVVPTGIAMFAAEPVALAANAAFRIKLGVLALAAANALLFHLGPYRRVERWERARPAPLAARATAALSLALWLAVIFCGRLIAYV
jgi:hypothetical protein